VTRIQSGIEANLKNLGSTLSQTPKLQSSLVPDDMNIDLHEEQPFLKDRTRS
jgi:hypothetical protein